MVSPQNTSTPKRKERFSDEIICLRYNRDKISINATIIEMTVMLTKTITKTAITYF